jgi:hypothetical protein
VSTGKQLLVALREILEDLNLQYRLSYWQIGWSIWGEYREV